MITAVGVPLGKALSYIGINSRRVLINLECKGEEEWIKSLEEVWISQSEDQWVEFITMPDLEDEVPNINCLIVLFTGNKKDDGKTDPSIKSWSQPVGALKELLKKICKQKEALLLSHYHWPNELK